MVGIYNYQITKKGEINNMIDTLKEFYNWLKSNIQKIIPKNKFNIGVLSKWLK